MKKLLLLISAILLLGSQGYSQVAYTDALKLKDYLNLTASPVVFKNDSSSLNAIKAILVNYYPDLQNASSLKSVISALTTTDQTSKYYNPFLSPYLQIKPPDQQHAAQANTSFNANTITNTVGGLDVTNIADGIAKFLVKRAKEELFISIVQKLNDPQQFPEIPILFPRTKQLMDSFDSWQYANILNTLREAFDKDLQNILGDIPKLSMLKPTDYKDKVQTRVEHIVTFLNTKDGRLFISALIIGNGVINGQKIPDVIHTIAGTGYLGDLPGAGPEVKNAIQLFDILSYSVRSNQSGQNYIAAAAFGNLMADVNSKNLYLGLIYAQLKIKGISFGTVDLAAVVAGANAYVTNLLANESSLHDAMTKLSDAKKKGEKDLSSYWAAIFESAKQLFQSGANISVIDPRLSLPPQVQQVFTDAMTTLTAAHDISIKNYSAVVVDIVAIIPNNDKTKDLKSFLVKYGSFAANIVQAQNSDDVENAIESVALPVGSYTIKQRSFWDISLNAYVGYAVDFNAGASHGVYAPIGFSGSWGLSPTKNAGAITLFASFIDVGNLVSYRLTGSATDNLKQDIRLESIISPSAQLFYEIGGTPISLGCGYRRTPKLFYSNNTGFIAVQPKNAFNISLLFDIPIFTLHNSPYKELKQ